MPRTKPARKLKENLEATDETDSLVKDFERQAHIRLSKMEAEAKMAIKGLVNFINLTTSRLPLEVRQMTLGELLNPEIHEEKENCEEVSSSVDEHLLKPHSVIKGKETTKRITAASDDGYVTEGIATSRASRTQKPVIQKTRKTRSSSRSKQIKLSEINQETAKKTKKLLGKGPTKADQFRTPALRPNNTEYGLVTPKIKPNTPLNVLRRPRQGEMVLSMQGSPLLVSAVVQENVANVNVPLGNGSIMSLLPKDGLRMSHIPTLDVETMRQLETLKNHIEKVILTK
ncbi:borealin-related [Lasioglossum baleicum]|uniref:borealin-related n=1 Tax=Lasioglossum baleicum TaxID=434251 RepID=UPI003FCE67AE